MKPFAWQWLVLNSLMIGTLATGVAAGAETRPQYGGTLRVAMRAAPASLDPADGSPMDSFARRNLTFLIFETLVTTDSAGRLHPGLATAWNTPDNLRWQFRLRSRVLFHDGTPLTAELVAASLRAASPSWKITPEQDSVIIEPGTLHPQLPAELALPHYAIAKRDPGETLSGTGPFHIVNWSPKTKLVLAAEDNYWQGRPYLDGIAIDLGASFRDQLIALELGRVDLIEVAPEQEHRVAAETPFVAASKPVELLAILFSRDPQTAADRSLRLALALSVDRASIRSVLLQGAGQPAASILPDWITGYGFVFPADADLSRARQERERAGSVSPWSIGYDSDDPFAHLLTERIALNARDAGLTLQPTTTTAADLRLVRIPLLSTDPWVALRDVAASTGLSQPAAEAGSAENLYATEQAMLATGRLIPLFHLPVAYGVCAALHDWKPAADGNWNLAGVWLSTRTGSAKP